MMTITLSAEMESHLRRKAERTGQDYNSLADALLLDILIDDLETATEADETPSMANDKKQQIAQILMRAFPGMTVDLDDTQEQRVHGRVAWDGFDGKDQVDRQTTVRERLKQELGPQNKQVGVLLTYTPTEIEAMQGA